MSVAKPSHKPENYNNRELSWLEFNRRVLEEAMDAENPLLERVKFFCIFSNNLDEFFEIRVASLKQQIEGKLMEHGIDGMTPAATCRVVARRVRELVDLQYACWKKDLKPGLAAAKIKFLEIGDLSPSDLEWVGQYYRTQVRPVLTPLAIDPAHPFPQFFNKSFNMIVQLQMQRGHETLKHLVVIQMPRVLPWLTGLPRPGGRHEYILLSDVIGHHLHDLLPGTRILGYWSFRITRNSELYIDEEEANLLEAVENELHNRRRGDVVRLEIEPDCPPAIRAALRSTHRLSDEDVYPMTGAFHPAILQGLNDVEDRPELRYPAFVASTATFSGEEFFGQIRERDILVHHPYESFNSVIRFLEQAAEDPNVLAIKQTLYRTGADPQILGALTNAVKRGKQVTVVVELRARFDEANNVHWARQLEESGAHVVYGLVGYKIHAKMTLVIRRDHDGIRRYLHLSSGNYNPTTAKIYTDVGFFTCNPAFGEDATNLFNLLTGICEFQPMQKLIVAPFEMQDRFVALVKNEADNARLGLPARIIAKMNSLVDPTMIDALYEAAAAGVEIDLIVRGICCLRPGVPKLSETIRVRSIVDRFLEHSRISYFENGCDPKVFVGSADWMPRNFFRRIEVAFPIEDGNLRDRLIHEILELALKDNCKARSLLPKGVYERVHRPGAKKGRSQFEFLRLASKVVSRK